MRFPILTFQSLLRTALTLGLLALLQQGVTHAAENPLRVFIRAGVKTHGPGQHDHPRFLEEWKVLLNERGIQTDGSLEFPTPEQLEATDVLVIYAQDGLRIRGQERARFETFLKRGGGLVIIHDAVVSGDQHDFAKKVTGGSWRWDGERKTKWLEGEVGIYFVNPTDPITRGFSNFDWKDEIYYDLDMAPDAKVLATSFHSVFVIAPQIWTYEKTWDGGTRPYRSIVSLPGHEYTSFQTPHYRALLLRSIAWAGRRENLDTFARPEELASITYPPGGPMKPTEAASKMGTHPEFDLSLVASEPLVEKVISLDWDPAGRLWVAETPEYPGGRTINKNDRMIALWNANNPGVVPSGDKEDRPARDRISWLEDTNGDGVMDRKHVFYEGLELVTSLVFYKDGVIVSQAPDILWIRDTDGDGKADKVEKLYTGFGTFDTHAVMNNLRWGMDGWIYGAVGYSAGNPTSPDGIRKFGRITAGVFRFRPDGSAVEQVASGSCNTWGFDLAPDGELFYSTATCGEHLLHIVMPEKAIARASLPGVRASAVAPDHQKVYPAVHHTRPAYVQIDWVGMFTAASGCTLNNGGAWPQRFDNMSFLSEPTVSLVHNEILIPSGPTYKAVKEPGREETEFIAGSDLWFRPIHARFGPEGALYVVDFYNQAAIHNDTRGPAHGARNAATRPDRDHHFSRIWKMQHKQARNVTGPSLAKASNGDLVKALSSENGWRRLTAHRLLSEKQADDQEEALIRLAQNTAATPITRSHALYILQNLGKLEPENLLDGLQDPQPIIRRNALRIAAERDNSEITPDASLVRKAVNDPDARARLLALLALATCGLNDDLADTIVAAWPSYEDPWTRSAALGVATKDPELFLQAAFRARNATALTEFVSHLTRLIAQKQNPSTAALVITLIANQPASTDALKQSVLETLAAQLKPAAVPPWSASLATAFKSLLASPRPGLPGAALPLIARWDTAGSMSQELKPAATALLARLQDNALPDDQRGQVAVNLIGIRRVDPAIIPAVAGLLGSQASPALQQRVIEALGSSGDADAAKALLAAYPKLAAELREPAFGQLIQRTDSALLVVQALESKSIAPGLLGTANLFRLRTHADKKVATAAQQTLDALQGPEQKQKAELVAKLRPEVEKAGDAAKGHVLYTQNCASCHQFKGEGRDLAPNLTGMGAHGAGDLLVHIVDPNLLVEPNFIAVSIETKDDLNYDGIIARENNAEVILRNATADYTVRKDNIKTRQSTGRSLMPEGFEALGPEGLRDLLAYICADELRFRILDLAPAFTANTTKGIYASESSKDESLKFKRFGLIKAGDVPFDVISPARSATGNNVVVLKGGSGLARTFVAKASVKAGIPASRIHVLGGVGGWAWPWGGDAHKNEPVAKIVVHYAGGATEEILLRNGVEIADYNGNEDVPGSKPVPDALVRGQIRWFTKPVGRPGTVIETLSLESTEGTVAPTFVAITLETGDAPAATPAPRAESAPASFPAIAFPPRATRVSDARVLVVGGGSSHDFEKWFHQADTETILKLKPAKVDYTEDTGSVAGRLAQTDLLYLSNNKPFPDAATRDAIRQFVEAGRPLLLVHPALWYNWREWPEYNRTLVGGGARSHDKFGPFEVVITQPDHPLVANVPKTFTVTDELYHAVPDEAGGPIEVLATAKSPVTGKVFPILWTTRHPKTRIACLTLGHDDEAHHHPAYQQILQNAIRWGLEPR